MARSGGRQERGFCSVCGHDRAVNQDGTIRRHDGRRDGTCPGTGRVPGPPPETPVVKPKVESANVVKQPEPVAEVSARLVVTAFIKVPEGTNLADHRQDLFDDPNLLYQVLCGVPNEHFSLTLKRQWS